MDYRGVTLIELISVIAISAVLMLVAAPSLTSYIQQQRLRAATDDLYRILNTARATAITQQNRISAWNQDGNWGSGVELFIDTDNIGQRTTGETVLSRVADHPDVTVSGNRNVANYISYLPNGRAVMASGAFQAGTITLCKAGLSIKYQLVISIGGRLRLEKSAASSCP